MDSPTSLRLEVIELQIAEREAELVALHLRLAVGKLSFEDYLAASNVLALLEHELTHWKALRAAVRMDGWNTNL